MMLGILLWQDLRGEGTWIDEAFGDATSKNEKLRVKKTQNDEGHVSSIMFDFVLCY